MRLFYLHEVIRWAGIAECLKQNVQGLTLRSPHERTVDPRLGHGIPDSPLPRDACCDDERHALDVMDRVVQTLMLQGIGQLQLTQCAFVREVRARFVPRTEE